MSAGGDYIDETHQRIVEFADEFIEDDEERASFIDGLMERRGYERAVHWAPPAQQGGQGPRGPLLKPKRSGGQRQQPQQQQGGQQQQQGSRRSYWQ